MDRALEESLFREECQRPATRVVHGNDRAQPFRKPIHENAIAGIYTNSIEIIDFTLDGCVPARKNVARNVETGCIAVEERVVESKGHADFGGGPECLVVGYDVDQTDDSEG